MIVFTEKYIKLEYIEEHQCIIEHWKGYLSSEEWKYYHDEILLPFVKKNKVLRVISDTKQLSVICKEDAEWLTAVFLPKLVKEGVKYVVFVIPDDLFTKISVDNFREGAEKLVIVKYFLELVEAQNWIYNSEIDIDVSKIIFQDNSVIFEYYPQEECLVQTWKGAIETDEWKRIHQKIVEISNEHKVTKIIPNTKGLGIVKKSDIDWASQYITPILVSKGLKYAAFVIPDEDFAKITTDTFIEGAKDKITIKYFDNLEKAKQWKL